MRKTVQMGEISLGGIPHTKNCGLISSISCKKDDGPSLPAPRTTILPGKMDRNLSPHESKVTCLLHHLLKQIIH